MSNKAKTSYPHVTIPESSWVVEPVKIGSGTHNRHFSDIMAGTEIGSNCVIGPNVMIGQDAVVRNRCNIQNHVCLYKEIKLEDDIYCGPSCVFTNVNYPPRIATRLRRSSTNR